MANELATQPAADIMERVLLVGDLGKLTPQERVSYYKATCESLGLNPLTRPFDYLFLNGKTTLYANRACTEQLRKINGVSIGQLEKTVTEGIYVVTAPAIDKDGRTDSSIGAVPIDQLKGEARANAMMKAETKAKRRVTLSICGLGWLDESEVDSIPNPKPLDHVAVEATIVPAAKPKPDPRGKVTLVDKPKPAEPLPPVEPEAPPVDAIVEAAENAAVAQVAPEPEVQHLPPVDEPPPSSEPITPATKKRVYSGVYAVNTKSQRSGGRKDAGTQILIELDPEATPVDRLTEAQGQKIADALEAALGKGK